MDIAGMTDGAILGTLGERVRRERLNQNRTQMNIAKDSGVALTSIQKLEGGKGCTLGTLIKILRALRKIEQLDSFLPEPGVSPLELARMSGRQRKEASGNRGRPSQKGR
jgi:hypothetical protein